MVQYSTSSYNNIIHFYTHRQICIPDEMLHSRTYSLKANIQMLALILNVIWCPHLKIYRISLYDISRI